MHVQSGEAHRLTGRSSSCRTTISRTAVSACRPSPLVGPERTVGMSVVLLRAAAVLLAAFWAVIFFGLIDLSVPFDAANRQEFSAELMLDTGWGIFVTVLVAAPLLVWSVRPNRFTTAAHLAVTAACFALAGLAGQVANFPLPVVGLLLSAAVVGPLGQRAARSAYEDPGIPPRWQLDRPTLVLTLLAAGPAVWVSVLLI